MTFLTRRKLQKNWDCDSRELRMVLRLPAGYRFMGMDVRCCRILIEYASQDQPEKVLRDTLDLQVPVRGEEAVHTLREEDGEQILSLWVPRHLVNARGYDVAARQAAAQVQASWQQVAS